MGKFKKNTIQKYEDHSFYCLNCGKRGIPIWRNKSHLYSKNHRKVLYCPYCQTEVNHLEIRNQEEMFKFKQDFEKGVYKEEATQSIAFIQAAKRKEEF